MKLILTTWRTIKSREEVFWMSTNVFFPAVRSFWVRGNGPGAGCYRNGQLVSFTTGDLRLSPDLAVYSYEWGDHEAAKE